ncbi:hypothetical protein J4G08_16165 [Candidatus Poribacteria bacterium]|nr:hypothetical protein [Candidatus Poribacteria bacterium]
MKKYKRVLILIIVFLIIAGVSCTTMITDEINIVDRITHDHYKVDPKGQLIVNAEIGEVSVEKTDHLTSDIDFDIKKEWKSGMMFQPNSKRWIKDMLKDLEVKIKRDPPDVRLDVKFKRGKQHWKKGLKWLTVNIDLKVPRQYKVVSNAPSK